MPRKPTPQQLYDELLNRHEDAIAKAFAEAVNEISTAAEMARLVRALEAGNVSAALDALHLDASAYGPLYEAMRAAYLDGGTAGADSLPAKDASGARIVVRFDLRNPRAEQWLRLRSSGLVTRLLDDQHAAVRSALAAGMEKGQNPRTVALDIVGRIDKATGKRQGGILGLSAPQEQAARKARDELTSADPEALRNYLTRARRDKRFDRSILKAIREETAPPADIAAKALAQYRNRLLALRGEMIGRTEALASLHAAQHEAYRQAVDSGAIQAADIRRTWRSAGDLRVRHTHVGLNGDTVGLDEPFRSPSGALMLYPGDTSFGAPASETIGCRCVVAVRVDFLANLR